MIAVRDNADSAAAYTLSRTHQAPAFALAGGIAGSPARCSAGCGDVQPAGRLHRRRLAPRRVDRGHRRRRLRRRPHPRLAVGHRPPRVLAGSALVPLLTSSVGFLVLLMYFPGGLVQIGYSARDALLQPGSTNYPIRRPAQDDRPPPAPASPTPPNRPPTRAAVLRTGRSPFASAAGSPSTTSRSGSAPTKSSGSSARTAPASPRS